MEQLGRSRREPVSWQNGVSGGKHVNRRKQDRSSPLRRSIQRAGCCRSQRSPDPDAAQRYLDIHIPRNSATWADERLEITDTLAEGDLVWARVTHSARHVGDYRGIPPTGKTKTNAGCIFCRVAAGKIVEHATLWDFLGELTQLGGVVVPGAQ